MYYTGIDLHKKTSYLTTVNKEGRIVKRANLLNEESLEKMPAQPVLPQKNCTLRLQKGHRGRSP